MRKIILLNMIVLAFLFTSNTSFGEENHASKDWQIKAYSTAAPSFIGKSVSYTHLRAHET